jgi:hypothetical protein
MSSEIRMNNLYFFGKLLSHTKAVSKVRGLAVVRRCYAEGDGDCYAKLWWWGVL